MHSRPPAPGPADRQEKRRQEFEVTRRTARFRAKTRLPAKCVRRFRDRVRTLVAVEAAARAGMADRNVTVLVTHLYHCWGREVWSRWRRVPPGLLAAELAPLAEKWRARGLDPATLAAVRGAVLAALGRRGG
jgi:hypothetical protein